jgi:hypothetical protein
VVADNVVGIRCCSCTLYQKKRRCKNIAWIVIAIAVLALAMSFIIKYQKLSNNIDIDKMGKER